MKGGCKFRLRGGGARASPCGARVAKVIGGMPVCLAHIEQRERQLEEVAHAIEAARIAREQGRGRVKRR